MAKKVSEVFGVPYDGQPEEDLESAAEGKRQGTVIETYETNSYLKYTSGSEFNVLLSNSQQRYAEKLFREFSTQFHLLEYN